MSHAPFQQPDQWVRDISTDTIIAVTALSQAGGMTHPQTGISLSLPPLLADLSATAPASIDAPVGNVDVPGHYTTSNHTVLLSSQLTDTASDSIPAPISSSSSDIAASPYPPPAEGTERLPSLDSSATAFPTSTVFGEGVQQSLGSESHLPHTTNFDIGAQVGNTLWSTDLRSGFLTSTEPHPEIQAAGERRETGSVNMVPPGPFFNTLGASFLPKGIDTSFVSGLQVEGGCGEPDGASRGGAELAAVMQALMEMTAPVGQQHQQSQQLLQHQQLQQQEQQRLQQQQTQYGLHLQQNNPHQQLQLQQQQHQQNLQAHMHLQQQINNGFVPQQHTNMHQQSMPYQMQNAQASFSHLPQQQQHHLQLYNLNQHQQQLYQQQQQQQQQLLPGTPLNLTSLGQAQDSYSQSLALNPHLFPNPHASFPNMQLQVQQQQQHHIQQINQSQASQQWSGLSLTTHPLFPNPQASFPPHMQLQGQLNQPQKHLDTQLQMTQQSQQQQQQQQGAWGGLHLSIPPTSSQQPAQVGNGVVGGSVSLSVSHSPALLAAGAAAAAAPHRGPKSGRVFREVSAMQTAALAWLEHRATAAAAAALTSASISTNTNGNHNAGYDALGGVLLGKRNTHSNDSFQSGMNGNNVMGQGQGGSFELQTGQGMGVGPLHLSQNFPGPDGNNNNSIAGAAMRMNIIAQYNNRARVRDRGERAQIQLQRLGNRIEARQQSALLNGTGSVPGKLFLGGAKAGLTRPSGGSSGSWLSLDLGKPDLNMELGPEDQNFDANNSNHSISQRHNSDNNHNSGLDTTGAEEPVGPDAATCLDDPNNNTHSSNGLTNGVSIGVSIGNKMSTKSGPPTKWQPHETLGSLANNNNGSTNESARASLLQSDAVRSLVRRGVRGAASYEGRCKGRRGLQAALIYRSGLQQQPQSESQPQSPAAGSLGAAGPQVPAVGGSDVSSKQTASAVGGETLQEAMQTDQAVAGPLGSESVADVASGVAPVSGIEEDGASGVAVSIPGVGRADILAGPGAGKLLTVSGMNKPLQKVQNSMPSSVLFPTHQVTTQSGNGSLQSGGKGNKLAGTLLTAAVASKLVNGIPAAVAKPSGKQKLTSPVMAGTSAARRRQQQQAGSSSRQVDSAEEDDAEARAIVLIAQRAAERRRITAAAAAVIAARMALTAAAKHAALAERGHDAGPEISGPASELAAESKRAQDGSVEGAYGDDVEGRIPAREEQTAGDGTADEPDKQAGLEAGSEAAPDKQPTRQQQLQLQLAQQAQQREVHQPSQSSWEQLGQVHLQQQAQQKLKGLTQVDGEVPLPDSPLSLPRQQEQQPRQRQAEPGQRYQQLVQRKRQSGAQPPRQRQGGRYCSASVTAAPTAAARKGTFSTSGVQEVKDEETAGGREEDREVHEPANYSLAEPVAAEIEPGGRWPVQQMWSEGWRFRRAVGPNILKGICVELGFLDSSDSLLLPSGPEKFIGSSMKADPDHPWHPLNDQAMDAYTASPNAPTSPNVSRVPMLQRMRDLEAHTRRKHRGKGLLSLIQEAHINLAAKLASSQRAPHSRQQPSPVLHHGSKHTATASRVSDPLPSKAPLHRKGAVGRPRLTRPEVLQPARSASPCDHEMHPHSSVYAHAHDIDHLKQIKSRDSLSGSGSQLHFGDYKSLKDRDLSFDGQLFHAGKVGGPAHKQQRTGEKEGARARCQQQQLYKDEDVSEEEQEAEGEKAQNAKQRAAERRRANESASLTGGKRGSASMDQKSKGLSGSASLAGLDSASKGRLDPPARSSHPSLDPGHDHPGSARSLHQKSVSQNLNSQNLSSHTWPATFSTGPRLPDDSPIVGAKHAGPVLHKLGHRQQQLQQQKRGSTLLHPPSQQRTNLKAPFSTSPPTTLSSTQNDTHPVLEEDAVAAADAAAAASAEDEGATEAGSGSQPPEGLLASALVGKSGDEESDVGVLARRRAALKKRLVVNLEPDPDSNLPVPGRDNEAALSQQRQKRAKSSSGGWPKGLTGGDGGKEFGVVTDASVPAAAAAEPTAAVAAATVANGILATAVAVENATAAVGSLNRRKKAAPSRAAN